MKGSVFSLYLDLHRAVAPEVLTVKRGDTARELRVTLVEDGSPYEITPRCAAALLSDISGADAVEMAIDGNVLTTAIPAAWCASSGEIGCEVRVFDPDGGAVTSPRFSIVVSDTLFADAGAEVYYGMLEEPVVTSIHRADALLSMDHIKAGTESKVWTVTVPQDSTKQIVVAVPIDYRNTVVPTFLCEGVSVTPTHRMTELSDRFGVAQAFKYYTVANRNVSVEWTVTIPTATEDN